MREEKQIKGLVIRCALSDKPIKAMYFCMEHCFVQQIFRFAVEFSAQEFAKGIFKVSYPTTTIVFKNASSIEFKAARYDTLKGRRPDLMIVDNILGEYKSFFQDYHMHLVRGAKDSL